jgi:molybdenum cofactor cytidylyltransferase
MTLIAGVILAAGMSKRLGSTKQLLKLDGKYLIERIVEAATNSNLTEIYLVLGWQHERILDKLPHLKNTKKIKILFNPSFTTGMSSSVKCGLTAAKEKYDHVMFFVADQPFISSNLINHLIEEYIQSSKQICIPVCQEKSGNPALFNASYFDKLLQISGDKGGRNIIAGNPKEVLRVSIENPEELFDIDTMEDVESLKLPFSLDCHNLNS